MTNILKVKISDRWYTVEVEDLTTSPIMTKVDGVLVEVTLEERVVETPKSQKAKPVALDTSHSAPKKQEDQVVETMPLVEPLASSIVAPMPGVVISVALAVGDSISKGDETCVLEAMKMHQSIRSDLDGVVSKVMIEAGQQVKGGEVMFELSS